MKSADLMKYIFEGESRLVIKSTETEVMRKKRRSLCAEEKRCVHTVIINMCENV